MSRVEEIAKRLSEATPGPWRAQHRCVGCTDADDESCGLGLEIEGPPEASMRGQFALGADARFIAAAPDDIDYLLKRVRDLGEIDPAALLEVAEWFDLVDQLLDRLELNGEKVRDKYAMPKRDEIQRDLRKWALALGGEGK
ncbi:MAG: hypothetical protein ACYCZN_01485 [Candidatus Dormibacteria bacterium]